MKLAIVCNKAFQEEFCSKGVLPETAPHFVATLDELPGDTEVVMDLLFEPTAERLAALEALLPRPVIINAVVSTLAELDMPFIRINAWPGFLNRSLSEIVATGPRKQVAEEFFKSIGWPIQLVPDTVGMVSARVIAMIVNEAYYTFDAGISSREEIDIAMKLGTHYPMGPFEWSEKIGLNKIYQLLTALKKTDTRYEIAPALIKKLRESSQE